MYRFEQAFEEVVKEQSEFKASEQLNASIQMAKKCLTHGDFQKYREEFQLAYDNILHDMCLFTDSYLLAGRGTPEGYALKMVQYMQRIQDLRILLSKVNIDANKEQIKLEN